MICITNVDTSFHKYDILHAPLRRSYDQDITIKPYKDDGVDDRTLSTDVATLLETALPSTE
jgi:hypothetical protein